MKLEIPGQLRGPECKVVMQVATGLRKELEPVVDTISVQGVERICIILRVAGSLGDFGPVGIDEPTIEGDCVTCNVVFADENWADQSAEQVRIILAPVVVEALRACLKAAGVESIPKDFLSN